MKKLTDEFTMKDILDNPEFGVLCFLQLKTYEDTEVEPKQIKQMQLRIDRLVALVNALRKELGNVVGRFSREETGA